MPLIRTGRLLLPAVLVLVAVASAACGMVGTSPPAPTPADFQGIAAEIVRRGILVDGVVSGDAGCSDQVLAPTAIRFRASGLDQPTPVTFRLYIFRNGDSYRKLRSAVDACATSYATDRNTFVFVDASPFVLAGQGPLGPTFEAKLRDALRTAAGNGG
jgi:hypothetical protein